ncbi:GatB/YqeY domain-containing protein [Litoribrevibacter euphylliae]|uniref:GatB/YqeY domain-containing protein n=1 Tax=Litoribrevibacter euphylliae TaxID=1834034 RepID=A0ABV7HFI1_9GAMM
MSGELLEDKIKAAVKDAMRNKEKSRLTVLRGAQAAFKQIRVDEGMERDAIIEDTRIIATIDKMVKQRKDAASQYKDADRQDLYDQEMLEVGILSEFLPAQLTEDELKDIINTAKEETGAAGMQDMGKLMGVIKPQVVGKADMGQVSQLVKAALQ